MIGGETYKPFSKIATRIDKRKTLWYVWLTIFRSWVTYGSYIFDRWSSLRITNWQLPIAASKLPNMISHSVAARAAEATGNLSLNLCGNQWAIPLGPNQWPRMMACKALLLKCALSWNYPSYRWSAVRTNRHTPSAFVPEWRYLLPSMMVATAFFVKSWISCVDMVADISAVGRIPQKWNES